MQQVESLIAAGRRYARKNGAGIAVSLVLHTLLALLVLAGAARHTTPLFSRPEPFLPIDLVRLGPETRSPPAEQHALVPQQRAGKPQQETAPQEARVSPKGTKPAPDDALDTKLKALAKLKSPDTKLKLEVGQGVSTVDASNGATGDSATYSVRDFVLAQVLRRWTIDLGKAKDKPLVIALQITMKRDGSITEATIIEQARAKTDAYYRDIALGARNAALLSSPINLPPGDYPKEMHFTLRLDTRAVLH
ncbi:hypothetical protein FHS83_002752 [Rhizomicrobium palustre]|uniref:Uncharacterized protein n=2 Tax=Rhizomicrobium palustre TaxID=189966 RepID=A0A846N0G2_9PROT|nr:hypothetical protein [Rhizomicrobium palustre]